MIKSALRLINYPLLSESVLANGVATYIRLNVITSRSICTTLLCNKEIRTKDEKSRVGKSSKYGLIAGETTPELMDINQQENLFPDEDTPNRLFNGVPYKELHIINIKSTPNNTIMNFTDYKGKAITLHSSGIEGFKNARKGTNIAAQQAAITFGNRIREYGINTVRIRVQGIGAGRMSSIKGLHMTGLNIVSVTDDTRVSWNPPRARKQRRV
ncbi:30S ribosomal protein S11 isoform X1 [Odontomachus brunneus]|uniref:30S ribosomal protein S11 isoform X1 n=2 Tax=Odontomachus brunneus TaxID=486640 RepID=UPI0013F1CCDC|nr:30S ribosomal protein S11 isoform X1 [Odontomachus brunneus]XP_032685770.1 30S ribosomal protein S11 isoform X1 [Odontomachus brunneus]XP_032685771.1 30S ribosomal protein S11 isoform X1 [Odontomachus brunneus]